MVFLKIRIFTRGIVLKYRLLGFHFTIAPSYSLCCSDYTFSWWSSYFFRCQETHWFRNGSKRCYKMVDHGISDTVFPLWFVINHLWHHYTHTVWRLSYNERCCFSRELHTQNRNSFPAINNDSFSLPCHNEGKPSASDTARYVIHYTIHGWIYLGYNLFYHGKWSECD